MTDIIAWEDPPGFKRGRRTSKFQPLIDKIKENPNVWALVLEDVNAASAKVLTTQGLKITTRSTGDGTGRVNVWAIYELAEEDADVDVDDDEGEDEDEEDDEELEDDEEDEEEDEEDEEEDEEEEEEEVPPPPPVVTTKKAPAKRPSAARKKPTRK